MGKEFKNFKAGQGKAIRKIQTENATLQHKLDKRSLKAQCYCNHKDQNGSYTVRLMDKNGTKVCTCKNCGKQMPIFKNDPQEIENAFNRIDAILDMMKMNTKSSDVEFLNQIAILQYRLKTIGIDGWRSISNAMQNDSNRRRNNSGYRDGGNIRQVFGDRSNGYSKSFGDDDE